MDLFWSSTSLTCPVMSQSTWYAAFTTFPWIPVSALCDQQQYG